MPPSSFCPVTQVYEFGRTLGMGNYGTVRECRRKCLPDQPPGPVMACKSISYTEHKRSESVARGQREVEVMALVGHHQHLVGLQEVHYEKDAMHLMLDYCHGGELFDVLLARGKLTEADAADVVLQLALGLNHCHSRGVLHRDVKLENILIVDKHPPLASSEASPVVAHRGLCASQGACQVAANVRSQVDATEVEMVWESHGMLDVKLGDFGLGVILANQSRLVETAGSPMYMAPEVVQKQEYGTQADMWSLGVVLFALLTGLLPFTGSSDAAVFHAITHPYLDLDTSAWDNVSEAAKSLVRRLLSWYPEERPTALQLLGESWVMDAVVRRWIFHDKPECVEVTSTKLPSVIASQMSGMSTISSQHSEGEEEEEGLDDGLYALELGKGGYFHAPRSQVAMQTISCNAQPPAVLDCHHICARRPRGTPSFLYSSSEMPAGEAPACSSGEAEQQPGQAAPPPPLPLPGSSAVTVAHSHHDTDFEPTAESALASPKWPVPTTAGNIPELRRANHFRRDISMDSTVGSGSVSGESFEGDVSYLYAINC
eukprot:TRINITY_DN36027_c0_g1_i1.p1 TRINITY_DN36027_c0_g1~~TRINITY_DN36027_c0_g1_i1.p1  ORF type:complete len:544 (+),score=47.69 TRINITY_DN36027_c0_g1_i1:299-1930(+)